MVPLACIDLVQNSEAYTQTRSQGTSHDGLAYVLGVDGLGEDAELAVLAQLVEHVTQEEPHLAQRRLLVVAQARQLARRQLARRRRRCLGQRLQHPPRCRHSARTRVQANIHKMQIKCMIRHSQTSLVAGWYVEHTEQSQTNKFI